MYDIDIALLRRKIVNAFNLEELNTLCFDLAVDFDELRGSSKGAKARELIKYMQRHNRLDELFAACQVSRPSVDWAACIQRKSRSPAPSRPPALTQVKGIGPTFANRLQARGIDTIEKLVALDEAKLAAFLGVNGRADAILTEAHKILNPPRAAIPKILQKVKGVGPTYAAKLYQAGVETIEEIADLNPHDLKRVLGARSSKRTNAILQEATRMVANCQHRGEKHPLERITGIGPAFARRLCRAGIDTIEELSGLDAHILAEILPINLEKAAHILRDAREMR